jgi:signal transduction histidine kinase
MSTPASLRRRATIASTVLGAVLCLGFAGATLWLVEDYEHVMVEELLHGQAEDYSRRLAADPATTLPRTRQLSGYLRRPGEAGDVPAPYAALPPGLHESANEDEDGIHVGVYDVPAGRMVFVIDITDIERLEGHLEQFVLAVLVLGPLLAGWLGWLLSGRALAPLRELASAVDALPARPAPTALAASVPADELGRLAAAIDSYQQRLVDADAHERAFFADASHELRTPLAVVQGAAEVLQDHPGADARMRARLLRLDRGLQQLTDLLEVLLGLARRNEYTATRLPLRPLLGECVAALALPPDGPRVNVGVDDGTHVQAPPRAAALLLRSLLRRLLGAATGGEVAIGHGGDTITLQYRPATVAPVAGSAPSRGDEGLGLTLIGRLATQLGWRIVETAAEDGSRRIDVVLPAPRAVD